MVSLEQLLKRQGDTVTTVHQFLERFERLPQAKINEGVIRSRLSALQSLWEKCSSLHTNILDAVSVEQHQTLPYFTDDVRTKAEDAYFEALDHLNELLDGLRKEASPQPSDTTSASSRSSPLVQLPRIDLPKFSGEYVEWENYRDMFRSLVADNELLSNVQKLHYLKISLTGEASNLLKNVTVTEANYLSAWTTLHERYENERVLTDAHFNSFINLPMITSESSAKLKQLRDTTDEALKALQNLDHPVEHWERIVAFILIQKLDASTRSEWEKYLGDSTKSPTYKSFTDFLKIRIRVLESIQNAKGNMSKQMDSKRPRGTPIRSHLATTSRPNCVICNASHYTNQCDTLKALNPSQRRDKLRERRCCFNCLRTGHLPKDCPSKGSCTVCHKRHHTLIHVDQPVSTLSNTGASASPLASFDEVAPATTVHHAGISTKWQKRPVLLATAHVVLVNESGNSIRVRALIDQGSESTFITQRIAQFLRASRQRIYAPITVVNEQVSSVARSVVNIEVRPCHGSTPTVPLQALVLPKITCYQPPRQVSIQNWSHIKDLNLADPDPMSLQPLDALFGVDMFDAIMMAGTRLGQKNEPYAQETIFGWVLSGPIGSPRQASPKVVTHCTTLPDLDTSLRRFWEIEEGPREVPLTREEQQCEDHFVATHSRNEDGRYIVRLPFKSDPADAIGDSRKIAERMLLRMESRLKRDDRLYSDYKEFMAEYQDLGHMEELRELKDPLSSRPSIFIPHHPVIRESSSTTRVRVVFNASCRTANGMSLNDLLLTGQKLQSDLSLILMRWRMHRYVFTADIQKMYRQIQVDSRDNNYQCILWRTQPHERIRAFKLLTVTYGTASAPFLALRVLKQLADDEGPRFPSAKSILLNDFYVDDVLSGADTITEATDNRDQLIALLNRGKFTLRKWSANDSAILNGLSAAECSKETDKPLAEDHSIKILGLTWKPASDSFNFTNIEVDSSAHKTKREILSIIAQLFDPLGWLAPVVIIAKILMQELWIRGIDWDSELPDDIQVRWREYCKNLSLLQNLSIPRWTGYTSSNVGIELHGFADASRRAYAAVIYLRIIRSDMHATVKLIAAKTKVAPIKEQSIPRLELCASVLLARLMSKARATLNLESAVVHAWADSTIVLAWIKQHPSTWKTFIANRVAEIQTLLPKCIWRHVSTSNNPADCASRGMPVADLRNHSLWWHGPTWLSKPSATWPSSANLPPMEELDLERRTTTTAHHVRITEQSFNLAENVSSWPRLLRVTAYCMRFIARLRSPKVASPTIALTADEVSLARMFWIKQAQSSVFAREIDALRKNKSSRNGPLAKLNPFLDKDGILRVGGRLRQSTLSFDEKHPIILPKHRVSDLIIAHAHIRCLHGGTQLTLRVIRQNFWILGARNSIKAQIHRCIPCTRERRSNPSQIMADLPKSRITPSRPFTHCGVDYAGPIILRASKGRGHKTIKAYIAIFVCFSTRAAHIELVSDYSSETFLAALRRFISRRGIPTHIYSDNGTTFQGADKELRRAFHQVTRDPNLASLIASDGINWSFIPPAAPHFGGIWEAGVKSVKHHLKRVVGAHTLTFEELTTLLCQIEACLNSRPIAPLNDDPTSCASLPPGHFLIGTPLSALPESSVLDIAENRLSRYQLIRRLFEQFWKRWSVEYLNNLQQRYRWFPERPNLNIGDMVLLKSDNLPPSKWQLGRIIECHRGRDKHTRVVTVKTSASIFKRPISQVCVLPVRTTNSAEI